MRKIIIFLTISLVPFTYLGMLMDWQTKTIYGYFLVLSFVTILAFLQRSLLTLLVSNLLSTIWSYWLASAKLLDYQYFFKPFSVRGLVIISAVLWLAPQLLAFCFNDKSRRRK